METKEIFDGRYIVYSDGRIFGKRKKNFVKPIIDINGYAFVNFRHINGKCMKIHLIIANLFIPNPNNLPQINHINGIKTDNRVENLEWCNNRYNCLIHHNSKFPGAYYDKRSKKWRSGIYINGKRIYLGYYDTKQEGSKVYMEYINSHNLFN